MDCIFCKIANKEIESNILYEDDLVVVIMDINPVVDGHALVIPKKHYTDYTELDSEIGQHIYNIAKDMGPILMDRLNKGALTLLVNYGDDQKVKHFHLHLLPDFGTTDKSKATRSVLENYQLIKKN